VIRYTLIKQLQNTRVFPVVAHVKQNPAFCVRVWVKTRRVCQQNGFWRLRMRCQIAGYRTARTGSDFLCFNVTSLRDRHWSTISVRSRPIPYSRNTLQHSASPAHGKPSFVWSLIENKHHFSLLKSLRKLMITESCRIFIGGSQVSSELTWDISECVIRTNKMHTLYINVLI
jgi:hypothetical protein